MDDALADLASLPAQAARLISRSLEPPPPNFPPGPDGDAAVELGADPLAFIVKAQASHGDVVGLRLAGERCVLVSDVEAAKDVLITRSSSFKKEGTAFFPGSSLAGEGLLVSDGEIWARQRRLSNPAFRRVAVNAYADAMASAGAALLSKQWSSRSLRDVYADFNDLTLAIVADALFGADVRGEDARAINGAIRDASRVLRQALLRRLRRPGVGAHAGQPRVQRRGGEAGRGGLRAHRAEEGEANGC